MRTTVRIDDDLFRRAKAHAAETGRSLGMVIEDALRAALARREQVSGNELPPLPTFGVGGVQPGVELEHNAALRDLMDGDTSVDALR